jgi:hypothetical protein
MVSGFPQFPSFLIRAINAWSVQRARFLTGPNRTSSSAAKPPFFIIQADSDPWDPPSEPVQKSP